MSQFCYACQVSHTTVDCPFVRTVPDVLPPSSPPIALVTLSDFDVERIATRVADLLKEFL